ncbi:MAG: ABC transporter ATP-binding protein, partial [Actinomycetota bacterium]
MTETVADRREPGPDPDDAGPDSAGPDGAGASSDPSLRSGRWDLLRTTLRAQRSALTAATLVGLAWTLGKIASPTLVRYGIDEGIEQNDRLWLWAGLIGVAGVVAGVFTAFRRYLAFREARWTEARLRERIFEHLLSLHVGYHDRAQTGQLMSRSSSDLQQIQMFVLMLPITLANIALIVGVVVILLVSDWQLALVALASLPLIQVVGARFSRTIHPRLQEVQAEQAALATVVEETIGGIRVVKGFGAEPVQSARLRREADDIRRVSVGAARVRATFLPLMEVLPQIGLLGVLWFGGNRVIDGDLTLGQLVQFNVYVALLVWPLRMIGMTLAFAQRARVALDRIDEILSVTVSVTSPDEPRPLPSPVGTEPVGGVTFRGVRFGYDPLDPAAAAGRTSVLDELDLHVAPG